jgi:hypothetical protein
MADLEPFPDNNLYRTWCCLGFSRMLRAFSISYLNLLLFSNYLYLFSGKAFLQPDATGYYEAADTRFH